MSNFGFSSATQTSGLAAADFPSAGAHKSGGVIPAPTLIESGLASRNDRTHTDQITVDDFSQ